MNEVKAYQPAAHSTLRLDEIDGKLKDSDVLVRALVGATGFLTISPLSSLVGALSISSFFDTSAEIDGTYRFKVRYDDTLANWTSRRNGWGKKSNVGQVESSVFKLTFKKSKIIGLEQGSLVKVTAVPRIREPASSG